MRCPRRPQPSVTHARPARRFATQDRNALLLYNGRFNEKHDFIALEIVEEQVQLTFSAGRAASRGPHPEPCAGLWGCAPPEFLLPCLGSVLGENPGCTEVPLQCRV